MKYRTWDWQLPFFAGFNSAFFLKDYAAAARYYQRAGELSGSDLSRLLAGRYGPGATDSPLGGGSETAGSLGGPQAFHARLQQGDGAARRSGADADP